MNALIRRVKLSMQLTSFIYSTVKLICISANLKDLVMNKITNWIHNYQCNSEFNGLRTSQVNMCNTEFERFSVKPNYLRKPNCN